MQKTSRLSPLAVAFSPASVSGVLRVRSIPNYERDCNLTALAAVESIPHRSPEDIRPVSFENSDISSC
jgi:hypothetical protein